MKTVYYLVILISLAIGSCSTSKSKEGKVYQCPMKCEAEKTYDKPGQCPVCKMELQEVEKTNVHISEIATGTSNQVHIVGEMRNVMHKGELSGTISIDTISNKNHLYGLGPVEYLTGEILIIDGKAYKTTVATSTTMHIEENWQVKAPFFVYANVEHWKEIVLPDSIQSIPQLETYIDVITKEAQRPFAFKIYATVETADIHIVNLPKGTKVSSPEDANKNQATYTLTNEEAEIVGFFSTEHQGVFTHHDSFVHMHLMTNDKTRMGHLDKALFKSGSAKLYLPQ